MFRPSTGFRFLVFAPLWGGGLYFAVGFGIRMLKIWRCKLAPTILKGWAVCWGVQKGDLEDIDRELKGSGDCGPDRELVS